MHWLDEAYQYNVENKSVHTLPYEKATGFQNIILEQS